MLCEAPVSYRIRATDMAKKAAKKADEKRGPGRPPKDAAERLGTPVSLWFADDQLKRIDQAVERVGMTRSEFLRQAGMEKAEQILGDD